MIGTLSDVSKPLTPAGFQLLMEIQRICADHDPPLNASTLAPRLFKTRQAVHGYLSGDTIMPAAVLALLMSDVAGWKPDDDRFQRLMQIRDRAKANVWYSDWDLTEEMGTLVGFETIATEIWFYELAFVPGPLQTEDYSRAVIRGGLPRTATDEDVESRHALRMERQSRTYKIKKPPTIRVILDQGVILRNVGGPIVMAKQLEFLASLVGPCELRILPFGSEAHPGMAGAFHILHFPPQLRQPAVYIDGPGMNMYLHDESMVRENRLNYERLWELALNPAESRQLLLDVAEEKRKR